MALKEYDYIRGNTVLAPKRKFEEVEKQKENKNKEIKKKKKLQRERREKTKGFISMVIVIAAIGAMTLSIDSYVYKTQKELLVLELDIKSKVNINEALKVDLLKIASLENINNVAMNQLDMIYPDKSSSRNIDMSKDYFAHLKEENEEYISTENIEINE